MLPAAWAADDGFQGWYSLLGQSRAHCLLPKFQNKLMVASGSDRLTLEFYGLFSHLHVSRKGFSRASGRQNPNGMLSHSFPNLLLCSKSSLSSQPLTYFCPSDGGLSLAIPY